MPTIRQLLDLVEMDFEVNQRASLRNLRYSRRRIDELVGTIDSSEFTYLSVQQFKLERQRQGASHSTINHELSWLSKGFRIARLEGLIDRQPRIEYFRIGRTNARQGFATPQQVRMVLRFLPFDVADYAEFAFLTGARRGEIRTLRWESVGDRSIKLVAANTKNRNSRIIPVNRYVEEILDRRRKVENGPLVFHRSGQEIRDFRHAWKSATIRAGEPGLLFHDLRRSFCRISRLAGNTENETRRVTGHLTRDTFDRYDIFGGDADLQIVSTRTESYLKQSGF